MMAYSRWLLLPLLLLQLAHVFFLWISLDENGFWSYNNEWMVIDKTIGFFFFTWHCAIPPAAD